MKLTIIAAMNAKRVIGNNGEIPWSIPEDLHRFKQLTVGHTVLMGRKTFVSIGKPLPERRNIVLTRSGRLMPGAEYAISIDSALKLLLPDESAFIIGGGEIFRQLLERADELLLTIVENDDEGDTFFPPYTQLVGTLFTLRTVEYHAGFRYESYVRSVGIPAIR
ncbi:MAG: dihydrofolate reductase [Bacteroidetes bacterium]|nr:dihydrofolate reductase [Bacteroidota bacterium]